MRQRKRNLALLVSTLGVVILAASCHKKAVAPPPPPPPPAAAATPTVNLTAVPSTIQSGESVTLSWTSENATSLDLQPGVGAVQSSGSTSASPMESTTYTLTATGPGGTATATARVTVTSAPPPPPAPAQPSAVTEETLFEQNIKDAYFDYNKSDIRPDAQQALTADADFLKAHPSINFTIEGHCDDRGSEEYNLGLGDRRATSAKTFLVNLGISASRMTTISYGKDRPFCTEQTEACRQENRRAHLVLGGQ